MLLIVELTGCTRCASVIYMYLSLCMIDKVCTTVFSTRYGSLLSIPSRLVAQNTRLSIDYKGSLAQSGPWDCLWCLPLLHTTSTTYLTQQQVASSSGAKRILLLNLAILFTCLYSHLKWRSVFFTSADDQAPCRPVRIARAWTFVSTQLSRYDFQRLYIHRILANT